MDLQKQLKLFDIGVLKQITFVDLLHYTSRESFFDLLEKTHFYPQKTSHIHLEESSKFST